MSKAFGIRMSREVVWVFLAYRLSWSSQATFLKDFRARWAVTLSLRSGVWWDSAQSPHASEGG